MDEKELEKIEDKLIEEEQRKREKPMSVSGKGVFLLKKIKEKRSIKDKEY